MIRRPRCLRTAAAVLAVAGTAVACTHSSRDRRPTSVPSPTRAGAVHVLGLWSGPEFDSFDAVRTSWESSTGRVVDWQDSQDPASDLTAAIAAGHPPDIAV